MTIVIPIFNAYTEVVHCLTSLQANTRSAHRILLLDDNSSDQRIWPLLQEWSSQCARFRALRNETNCGYTATINRGLTLAEPGDVILLNSDTCVPACWLEQLSACAYSRPNVATVTALSNAAGAFSVPLKNEENKLPPDWTFEEMAALIERLSPRLRPAVPTGNGFCMFLTGAARAVVGEFDDANFPQGYGEENDYCLRAMAAGFVNLIDDATYVYHQRSASFGARRAQIVRASSARLVELHPQYPDLVARWDRADALDPMRRELQNRLEAGPGLGRTGQPPSSDATCLLLADEPDLTNWTMSAASGDPFILLDATATAWTVSRILRDRWVPIRRYHFPASDDGEVLEEICRDFHVSTVVTDRERIAAPASHILSVLKDTGVRLQVVPNELVPRRAESKKDDVAANYRAALQRVESLERQLQVTEEMLARSEEKARKGRRKRTEANHYRALLHQLRARWYLRPFIRKDSLVPPPDPEADCWRFRGPRFEVTSSLSSAECRPFRILVVGHLLSQLLFGSENSLLETIATIDPDRFDVFTIFPEENRRIFAKLQPHVQGIAVLDYRWWRADRPCQEKAVSAFEEICRSRAIDLVHANTIMLRDPLVAARRLGLPTIIHARELIREDEELAGRLGGTAAEIVRAVCENATYLLANSATTLANYPCGERGGYLYNGIDPAAFDFANAVDSGCIKVGLVSSNIPKKGIFDFLELARQAEASLPALEFHLIGPENDLIRNWRACTPSFPANFRFCDYVPNPADAYRDLNILLNLSRVAESFGRTAAEAMLARRPVIAYRHGALPELIDDGRTGFLVPYLDLSAVLERLEFFVKEPGEIARFGEAARAHITQLCSPRTLGQRLGALYEKLILDHRPAILTP